MATSRKFIYNGIEHTYEILDLINLKLAVYDEDEFLYFVKDIDGIYNYITHSGRVILKEPDEGFSLQITRFDVLESIAKYGLKEVY